MTGSGAAVKLMAALLVAAAPLGLAGCTIGAVDGPGAPSSMSRAARTSAPPQQGASRYWYPAAQADPLQNFGDFYAPAGAHAPGSVPLVVLIHGGGWKSRSGSGYTAEMARALQAAGLAVWNIEYRRVGSGGGWPTTLTDVGDAVDFVPELMRRSPLLDPTNVILVGHSAGGQLAAWAATRRTLPAGAPGTVRLPGAAPMTVPRAFISLAGVLDMRLSLRRNDHVRTMMGGSPATVADRFALANPIQRIDPTMPSVAVHGTKDSIVPAEESENFVRAAQAIGAPSLFIPVDGAPHSALVNVRTPYWPTILSIIVRVAREGFAALAADPPR